MAGYVDNTIQVEQTYSSTLKSKVRILLLEDVASDAELNELELKRAGILFQTIRVETREDFLNALQEFVPDAVLADYTLPQFSAMEALELLKDSKLDIPFILVTGSQSEEVAVACLNQGADDYLLKQSLKRLPSALVRALEKKEAEHKTKTAEQQLRTSNKELRALSAHLQSVREEERRSIAREIHDELGQTLTALRLDLAWMQNKLSSLLGENHKKNVDEQIQGMSKLVDSTIQTVRRISTELRPRILDELGLIPSLEWQTEDFQSRTGIHCLFSSNVKEITFDQNRSTAIFRIVQESLTNIIRHAHAKNVIVRLDVKNEKITLEVEDDGKGIDETTQISLQSFGIFGMKERAHLLGGTVDIVHRRGGGTKVLVQLPIRLEEQI